MKSENYDTFIEKFKPKKTTDDCYTPPNVYNVIADWVAEEYELSKNKFVRPFYPGGDYENFNYNGCVVVDNPPFSILAKIIRFYIENDIKFFLFAPTLTLFSGASTLCSALSIGVVIEYENGAKVNTSFVTNLEPKDVRIRTVPKLYQIVEKANKENIKSKHKQLPKYLYPQYIVTSAQMSQYCRAGIELVIPRCESVKIESLDSQKESKKKIFGKGYLVSERCRLLIEKAEQEKAEQEKAEQEKAEQEKAERAQEWHLSEREYNIVKSLNPYVKSQGSE